MALGVGGGAQEQAPRAGPKATTLLLPSPPLGGGDKNLARFGLFRQLEILEIDTAANNSVPLGPIFFPLGVFSLI